MDIEKQCQVPIKMLEYQCKTLQIWWFFLSKSHHIRERTRKKNLNSLCFIQNWKYADNRHQWKYVIIKLMVIKFFSQCPCNKSMIYIYIYIYIYIFVNFKQKKLKFLENTVLTVFPNTTKMYSSRASQMIIFVKFLTIPAIYIIIKSLIIVGLLNQTIDFYGSIRKIYVLVI